MKKKLSVIIAAAGNATRLGLNKSKLFLKLNDKPLIFYSLEKLLLLENLLEIVIVTNDIDKTNELISSLKSLVPMKIVSGGELRQDSVHNGFLNVSSNADLVLIHDVGRPFFNLNDTKNCIEEASISGAAILCTKVVDTIKEGKSDKDKLIVDKTLDREILYQIQTPQVFSYELLSNGYKAFKGLKGKSIATDEAKMIELLGKPVNLINSSKKNFKITTSEDLEIAEGILKTEKSVIK